MYEVMVRPAVDKILSKLYSKNRRLYERVIKKIAEVAVNPHRYKNLRAPMQDRKRVHIDRRFVLIFSIDEKNKTIILIEFDHHDKAYKI